MRPSAAAEIFAMNSAALRGLPIIFVVGGQVRPRLVPEKGRQLVTPLKHAPKSVYIGRMPALKEIAPQLLARVRVR
jgi:hypothetical protein